MSRRRVLILCYFYPPLAGGGVHRVLGWTRGLPDHGWDCTVVCAGAEDYWVRDESLLGQIREGTEVIRVPGASALSRWLRVRGGSPGRRSSGTFAGLRALSDWWLFPDPYAGWIGPARRAAAARLARGGVDVLLSSSPPDSVHLAAQPLASRFRVPWVADFRDPWIGLHFRTPVSAWHRARHARAERAVLEHADLVLTASRTHADMVSGMGVREPARVVHLPNGYVPAPAGEVPAPPGPRATFELVWTGTLSQMPDAGTLLDALHDVLARHSEARRRLRVRLLGPFDTGYQDRAVALGLTGIVEFLGPRPHAETRRMQGDADLLLLWKPRGYPTMVPGKLYEYLDAGRPVLGVLAAGEEAATLLERGGGERVDPGDRAALAAAIERRYLAWKSEGRAPGGRPAWLDGHARPALAARLASLLDPLVESRA